MTVYSIDPLQDPRWLDLLNRHPDASVFHAPSWMRALHKSYGYECSVLTTTEPGKPLENGIAFCRVSSWLTGSRIVSLPFADHCQPLVDSQSSLDSLLHALHEEGSNRKWKYVELRPLHAIENVENATAFSTNTSFAFHTPDLTSDPETILKSFHKNQIQQKIKKAAKMGLTIEHGRSEAHLQDFYNLLLVTRRRHQLPPQPRTWFESLIQNFGEDLDIWVARHEGQPIASILTLASARTYVYKYGCSNAAFHNLGGMQALMWGAIQSAKSRGAEVFDFGRSDLNNEGLISYKDQWGTQRHTMHYYRNGVMRHSQLESSSSLTKRIFASLPDSCLIAAGRLLYRHMG